MAIQIPQIYAAVKAAFPNGTTGDWAREALAGLMRRPQPKIGDLRISPEDADRLIDAAAINGLERQFGGVRRIDNKSAIDPNTGLPFRNPRQFAKRVYDSQGRLVGFQPELWLRGSRAEYEAALAELEGHGYVVMRKVRLLRNYLAEIWDKHPTAQTLEEACRLAGVDPASLAV